MIFEHVPRAVILAGLLVAGGAMADATFEPIYLDGTGEGFNSNDPPHTKSSEDGNPGDTLGEQRRWAFEKALEFWELRLDSGVPIEIEAEMSDLACDSTSAVLGSAGANTFHANWTPGSGGSAPAFSDTWYGQALANKIANKDNVSSTADIGSEFNKTIDESDSCLGTTVWYYALGTAPSGTVSFYRTVLHEIGHGINVQTIVDLDTGEKASGLDDIYMRFLEDHSLGKMWPPMTDSERESSATDTNDLHWTGSEVLNALSSLSDGKSGGHVEMYAPSPLEPGSSVSHWDTDVDDNDGNSELMEPSATGTEKLTVTDEMLHDMGWNDVPANNCDFASDRLNVSGSLSGSTTHQACVSVTYDGAVVDSGDTSATAGQQVILKNGFSTKQGATFAVTIDPEIGL